jgi:hypothetical protein
LSTIDGADPYVLAMLYDGEKHREVNGITVENRSSEFSITGLDGSLIDDLECVFVPRNSEIYDDFIWAYYLTRSGETGIGKLFVSN